MTVPRQLSVAAMVAAGSKVGAGRIMAAPAVTIGTVPATQPKQWYIGTGTTIRSSGVMRSERAQRYPLLTTLRCVSSTPLGKPVVPEVYCMFVTSSGDTAMSPTGRDAARNSFQDEVPR